MSRQRSVRRETTTRTGLRTVSIAERKVETVMATNTSQKRRSRVRRAARRLCVLAPGPAALLAVRVTLCELPPWRVSGGGTASAAPAVDIEQSSLAHDHDCWLERTCVVLTRAVPILSASWGCQFLSNASEADARPDDNRHEKMRSGCGAALLDGRWIVASDSGSMASESGFERLWRATSYVSSPQIQ